MKPNLADHLLAELVAGVRLQLGIDLAPPFEVAGGLAGSGFVRRFGPQAGIDQRRARHVAVVHPCQRALQLLDQVRSRIVSVMSGLAVAAADRGARQFIRQAGDDQA